MIRRMVTLMGGAAAGQLVTVLAAFVLTRLYTPEAFAHLEMFALITGIAAVLGTGKYEQALMLPESDREARVLFSAGQRATSITLLVVGGLAWFTQDWITQHYSLPAWKWVSLFLPFVCALAAHARLLEYWHHRQKTVGKVASAQALAPVTSEAIKMSGASFFSLSGLVFGAAAGLLMRWALLTRGLREVIQSAWKWDAVKEERVLEEYRDYPTWVMAGSAMNRGAQWLHVLLIGATLGPVLLGMMGLARRLVMQPLSLLAMSAAPVLFQTSTEKADGAPLRRLFALSLTAFAAVSAIVWIGVHAAPDNATAWLFGDEWRGAIDVVRILTPWFVLNFMTAGLGSLFHRVRKPRWITGLDALHLLAVLAGWYVGRQHPVWIGGGEWGALVGIVWAKCGYYLVNLAVLVTAVFLAGQENSSNTEQSYRID